MLKYFAITLAVYARASADSCWIQSTEGWYMLQIQNNSASKYLDNAIIPKDAIAL
jgi:hypothetical protein